jgi:hypothetical protein
MQLIINGELKMVTEYLKLLCYSSAQAKTTAVPDKVQAILVDSSELNYLLIYDLRSSQR